MKLSGLTQLARKRLAGLPVCWEGMEGIASRTRRSGTQRKPVGRAGLRRCDFITMGGDLFANEVINEPAETGNQHQQQDHACPAQPQVRTITLFAALDDVFGKLDPSSIIRF